MVILCDDIQVESKMQHNTISSLLFGDATRILYTVQNFLALLLFLCTVRLDSPFSSTRWANSFRSEEDSKCGAPLCS